VICIWVVPFLNNFKFTGTAAAARTLTIKCFWYASCFGIWQRVRLANRNHLRQVYRLPVAVQSPTSTGALQLAPIGGAASGANADSFYNQKHPDTITRHLARAERRCERTILYAPGASAEDAITTLRMAAAIALSVFQHQRQM